MQHVWRAAAILSLIWTDFAMANDALPEHYAESVMVFSLSEDGSEEISLRLARFPGQGTATIWLHVATPAGAWSLADETFELAGGGATPVRADTAVFAARQGDQQVTFESFDRNDAQMGGRIRGTLRANATRHPELGSGDTAVALDLTFLGDSPGFRSQTNRWELTGRITGTIQVEGESVAINHPGKWHEQTGPREGFAPAFTYFNVQGRGIAMLVVAFAERVTGYALLDGNMHGISTFKIDGRALERRHFRAVLTNDQIIEGTAEVVQAWSVPIEGRRRPGTSILVESNVGSLLGTLNDWDPAG
jgi:hypothetical protein